MPSIVIVVEGKEDKVSKTGFKILAKYVQANQKYRKEFGYQNKDAMLYWENKALAFLNNPLIEISDEEKITGNNI